MFLKNQSIILLQISKRFFTFQSLPAAFLCLSRLSRLSPAISGYLWLSPPFSHPCILPPCLLSCASIPPSFPPSFPPSLPSWRHTSGAKPAWKADFHPDVTRPENCKVPQRGLEGSLAIPRRYTSGAKPAWKADFRPNVTRQEYREVHKGAITVLQMPSATIPVISVQSRILFLLNNVVNLHQLNIQQWEISASQMLNPKTEQFQ